MQSAVRQYGVGPEADRTTAAAMKRFVKWLARHPRRTPSATTAARRGAGKRPGP